MSGYGNYPRGQKRYDEDSGEFESEFFFNAEDRKNFIWQILMVVGFILIIIAFFVSSKVPQLLTLGSVLLFVGFLIYLVFKGHLVGKDGDTGFTGPQGPMGERGEKGDTVYVTFKEKKRLEALEKQQASHLSGTNRRPHQPHGRKRTSYKRSNAKNQRHRRE